MNWLKRNTFSSIKDVVLHNTGLTDEEMLNPPKDYFIKGLNEAAMMIEDALYKESKIAIYADYDADGITSAAILYRLLKKLGTSTVEVILPKRFSEGYGLSLKSVESLDCDFLITIDNGITAVDEISAAKEKGIDVLVLDHHLAREDGILPNADVIVNPTAIPGSDFSHYCGAGLAYKLCQLMTDDEFFLASVSGLAAIGTIADVMPLILDNRNIVKEGINNLNRFRMVLGVRKIFDALKISECNEQKIGFAIAPLINACGRMVDDGARIAWEAFVTDEPLKASDLVAQMLECNEKRKKAVEDGLAVCESIIENNCLFGESPLVIYPSLEQTEVLHEGVSGILAGRLSEKYNCPAFVFTYSPEKQLYKGSGRVQNESIHLKELLDKVSKHIEVYGGHSGAAGLSIAPEKMESFRIAIQEEISNLTSTSTVSNDEIFYDLEINAKDIKTVMSELKVYAPFGAGNPRPTFLIKEVQLVPRSGVFSLVAGDKSQHIRLFGNGYDIIAFNFAQQYKELEEPLTIDILGKIGENVFRNTKTIQVEAIDVKKCEPKKSTSLADALSRKLKSKGL